MYFNTYANPLTNLHAINTGRICTSEEMMPTIPSSSSVDTNTTFRPLVSAKQPQKYEPRTIPKIRYFIKKVYFQKYIYDVTLCKILQRKYLLLLHKARSLRLYVLIFFIEIR